MGKQQQRMRFNLDKYQVIHSRNAERKKQVEVQWLENTICGLTTYCMGENFAA